MICVRRSSVGFTHSNDIANVNLKFYVTFKCCSIISFGKVEKTFEIIILVVAELRAC